MPLWAIKDQFDRYPASESLAFNHGFLQKPLIDIWAYKFREILKTRFPDYVFKQRRFKFISTVDVDVAFSFKYKGIVRIMGGLFKDLFHFKLYEVWYRMLVATGFRKDPFDTYDDFLEFKKVYGMEMIFFFLVGAYTTFDKNVSARNSNYISLIKSISDYADVGLHPSYFTMDNEVLLKKEKLRMENIVNRPVEKSRQHYLRIHLPETYQNLINLEIKQDYTMGYASQYGFRASTCTPFYFYDLDYEIQTPLKVFPFAVMDVTLQDYLQLNNKESYEVILHLANQVKAVDGIFITLFHNETLSNRGKWRRWKKLYIDILKQLSRY